MPLLKTLHHGGIRRDGHLIHVFTESSRQKLIYAINNWFLDYFYANQIDILQLPPLDDWQRSTEDGTYWSVKFPDETWDVFVRSELIEF